MTTTQELIALGEGWDPKARAVPGATWDRGDKKYYFDPQEATPRSAAIVLRLFPELQYQVPDLVVLRDQLAQDVRPFDNATPFDTPIEAPYVRQQLLQFPCQMCRGAGGECDYCGGDGQAKLYKYQELDLGYEAAILESYGAGYIGWERGMGKTLAGFALIEDLGCEHSLVVCPNTAKLPVWAAEAEHFTEHHKIQVLPNVKAKRERMIQQIKRLDEPTIFIAHYEALAIIGGKDGRGWKKLPTWDISIADEAHRASNPKAKMTRALKKVPTKLKLALSGSIIQNHAEELFSQLQWLFPDRYSSKWRDWNDRYLDFVDNGYGRMCIGIKLERLEELRNELGVFMVYRRKEDELDLPPRTEQTLLVDMSAGQRKAYDQLRDECLTRLDDESLVVAMDGLPMLTKLRQVATGLDLLGEVQDSSKLDLAAEMIVDNPDEATVVFAWYKAAAEALAARLEGKGIEAFMIHGDVRQDRRGERIERFQAGEGQVLIGTLSTMGESVNLQRANNAIFLDRSWNPATNVQAEDRIYRIGQDKPVTITHLIAKDTVDELRVQPTIANKEALRRLILGGS